MIADWMKQCAEAIASMPFHAATYEYDIAHQIALHSPEKLAVVKVDKGFTSRWRRIKAGHCWRCNHPKLATKGNRTLRICETCRVSERDKKRRNAAIRRGIIA